MHGSACIVCAIRDDAPIDRACYRRAVNIGYLARARLAEAEAVLAESCAYDRASVVADEKLFGPGPTSAAQAFGAWEGNDLVGVASVSARWLRVLAVRPDARNRGIGTALLDACETAARADTQSRLSVLDQPGNYLAPGVDLRNVDTISWLERRGFLRGGELRSNVLINVRDKIRDPVMQDRDATHG
jgi:GNAT superfamily N-acetyltransferase